MSNRKPSQTALGVATARAAHRLLDDRPFIFDDNIALRLLGPERESWILENAEGFRAPDKCALRSHVLVRSRYTEDCLEDAVSAGIRQFVILGAGFDSFACRQPEWARGLTIAEVDHPSSQLAKREAIAAAGFDEPGNVAYVSADFETDSLMDKLLAAGLSVSVPTFFSCLWLTAYLTGEANREIFTDAGSFAKGSEMVVAFHPRGLTSEWAKASERDPAFSDETARPATTYSYSALQNELKEAGFSSVSLCETGQIRQRYFQQRTYLAPPAIATLVRCFS